MNSKKKNLVLGAGVSGRAAAALSWHNGIECDIYNDQQLSDQHNIDLLEMGCIIHYALPSLENYQKLILSPGVHPDHPLVRIAQNANLEILSEIDFALEAFDGKLIAVTGTNGKSTCTSMITHILNGIGIEAVACGNIGKAASQCILDGEDKIWWVMEISSYQLETSRPLETQISLFLSFSPDHLERHGSMQNYFDAKWTIFQSATKAIVTQEVLDALKVYKINAPDDPYEILPDEPSNAGDLSSLPLNTAHDQRNAAIAAYIVSTCSDQTVKEGLQKLKNFKSLEHRFESIPGPRGSQQMVVNDSKSTNVACTQLSIQNMPRSFLLLMGGLGKNESFAPLAQFRDKIDELWAFGTAWKTN